MLSNCFFLCYKTILQKAPHAELWKHIQERHLRHGRSNIGVIRMVSLGADLSNRAPTFDMDVSELFEQTDEHTISTSEIISYAQAREFFARDPSRQWAAYVGGCIIVLMREKGLVFQSDEGNLSKAVLFFSLILLSPHKQEMEDS